MGFNIKKGSSLNLTEETSSRYLCELIDMARGDLTCDECLGVVAVNAYGPSR
jgi:hypothetical protein